jgi:putative peptidoglycan lipid II flippase
VQIPPLLARGLVPWPHWEPCHPAIGRSLWLLAPTLVGAAMYQINVMVNTALASVLPAGSVSYLWYADRVFEFPVGLFAAALGTAALPSFATQAARGAYGELRDSVGFSIRLTNFVAVPAMVGILSLATPIVTVLFQRGAFSRAEVALTAQALAAFTVGLWSLSIVRILVPAFYAMNDTRTPVLTAAASFATNICCSLMFMGPVPVRGESVLADGIARLASALTVVNLRHAGLALATSVAATVNLVLLLTVLRRRLEGLAVMSLLSSLIRSLAAASVMVVPVRWLAGWVDWAEPGQLAVKLGVLLASICLGMGVFGVVAYLLGGEDVGRMSRFLRERLWRSDA